MRQLPIFSRSNLEAILCNSRRVRLPLTLHAVFLLGGPPYCPLAEQDVEPIHPTVLVVPIPDADPRPPLQGAPGVKAAAEDPVGGGEEGDWEVEGPVEGTGPPGRVEVQPGGAGLYRHHGCRQAGSEGGG